MNPKMDDDNSKKLIKIIIIKTIHNKKKSSYYALTMCQATVLIRIFYGLTHLIFTTTLWARYYPHFTDEEDWSNYP